MFLGLGPFVSPGEAFLREELSAGPLQWRETEPGVQERGAHAPARVGTVPARSRSARAPGRCPLQRVLGEGRLPHHTAAVTVPGGPSCFSKQRARWRSAVSWANEPFSGLSRVAVGFVQCAHPPPHHPEVPEHVPGRS